MDIADKKLIGARINTLLTQRNIKQKELASFLGVSDNQISYFVNGTRTPNISQIVEIANFFEVSADYLLGLSFVETTDINIKSICARTGLSEQSIEILETYKSMLKNFSDDDYSIITGFLNKFIGSYYDSGLAYSVQSYKISLNDYIKNSYLLDNEHREQTYMNGRLYFYDSIENFKGILTEFVEDEKRRSDEIRDKLLIETDIEVVTDNADNTEA